MRNRPQSHDGSTRFTEDNSTYPADKYLPLHNLKLYQTVILIWNIQISACMKEENLAILTTEFERTKTLEVDNLWFSSD